MTQGRAHEPCTEDKHQFGDECPDCVEPCADALVSIAEYISTGPPGMVRAKAAALVVLVNRMTVAEATAHFEVTKWTIYKHRNNLAEHFGFDQWNNSLRQQRPNENATPPRQGISLKRNNLDGFPTPKKIS